MSDMRAYRVKGEFMMGKRWQPFSKEFVAQDERQCVELASSIIGSKHRVKRKFIKIAGIEQVKNLDELKDPVVRARMSEGA